jgi:hypothetical protein
MADIKSNDLLKFIVILKNWESSLLDIIIVLQLTRPSVK